MAMESYRDVSGQEQVHAATYPPRRASFNSLPMDRSLKAKSRVFRNVQVPVDDEPRLFRASGRFYKKVVAAVPTHDTTTASIPPRSLDSTPAIFYDEGNHHVNKMTEDNSVMEEAAEYAKGLERTTVAVRGDELIRTTVAPAVNAQSVPAIITTNVVDPVFAANAVVPNGLQTIYQQQRLGQVGGQMVPLALQQTQNPLSQPMFPALAASQLAPQAPHAIPPTPGNVALPNALNPAAAQFAAMQQFPTAAQQFPTAQVPPIPARHFAGASPPPPPHPPVILPPQPPLAGQVPAPQVPQGPAIGGIPTQAPPPPMVLPDGVEIINGQAANSSLEQLGCGFDWLTNSCKDVFSIGWCGQCHDFGNIFVHDCKCVRPLITLPPRQEPVRPTFFSMI
ncbi:unnamed protein product [Heligmosomoides polygyrus]|uniref:SH3 domain-containing protein n=1 Tax=Heligmosomoides polygyrus TaxID=6339 RepID=A0A3P7Y6E3_HELPZ|nr:unnamed protein product [Heligmosomoides polygyrus]